MACFVILLSRRQ